jgi:NAD(P)H-hydrate epimerase
MVKIFTHESNRVIIQEELPEALLDTYTDQDTPDRAADRLRASLAWADIAAAGPGMGTDETGRALLGAVLDAVQAQTGCPRLRGLVLDADALRVLINHYEAKDRPHTEITLHTYDLQRIVIALIDEEVEKSMKAKRAETQEAKDSFQEDADRAAKLKDVFADLNRLVREDHDWTLNIAVIG